MAVIPLATAETVLRSSAPDQRALLGLRAADASAPPCSIKRSDGICRLAKA